MIALLSVISFALVQASAATSTREVVQFVECEIPGLRVDADYETGQAVANLRYADIDGNGAQDLLLPTHVVFQRDGLLETQNPLPMPGIDQGPACDIWNNLIFLRFEKRLETMVCEDRGWRTQLTQNIDWPGSSMPDGMRGSSASGPGVHFARFLNDFDRDGVPEIAVPSVDGLHVYRKVGDRYESIAVLDVFPAPRTMASGHQALWPTEERTLVLPARGNLFTFVLNGPQFMTVSPEFNSDKTTRYRMRKFLLDEPREISRTPPCVQDLYSPTLPKYLAPRRLNVDDTVDFAGGEWRVTESAALPLPIYEVCATTDGGKTLQVRRTVSFLPRGSFVDFDSDNNLDMVTQSTGLFEGGIRETVSRFLTSRDVAHEVSVYRQDAQGHFSDTPNTSVRFHIQMDAPPACQTQRFARYQTGHLVSLMGDFDGNGRRDLAVWDRPERLAIFLTQGDKLSNKEAAVIPMQPGDEFEIIDVDGDARSDVVIQPAGLAPDAADATARVFLARETYP